MEPCEPNIFSQTKAIGYAQTLTFFVLYKKTYKEKRQGWQEKIQEEKDGGEYSQTTKRIKKPKGSKKIQKPVNFKNGPGKMGEDIQSRDQKWKSYVNVAFLNPPERPPKI